MKTFGYDPGGDGRHGVAVLAVDERGNTNFEIDTVKTAEAALNWFVSRGPAAGIGVDTLTVWSTGELGLRPADQWICDKYDALARRVLRPNSLRGAMIINGLAVVSELAREWQGLVISETHPKVLYHALTAQPFAWQADRETVEEGLSQLLQVKESLSDHEWDALISAYALRQGVLGHWKMDLHLEKTRQGERLIHPIGPTKYYWPT